MVQLNGCNGTYLWNHAEAECALVLARQLLRLLGSFLRLLSSFLLLQLRRAFGRVRCHRQLLSISACEVRLLSGRSKDKAEQVMTKILPLPVRTSKSFVDYYYSR